MFFSLLILTSTYKTRNYTVKFWKGLMVGYIIGFYEGETSMEGYIDYTVDTHSTICFVNHKINDHFIDFSSEVINHHFGCGRSFPSTEANIFNYVKYLVNSFKYNIIT